MSEMHVRSIANHIRKEIEPLLDLSGLPTNQPEAERTANVASKALAAYALQIAAGVDAATASVRVTDGPGDCGIDAIHFNLETQTLFVVQSKWHQKGTKTIELGDALKVVEGIKLILSNEDATFGVALRSVWDKVKDDFLGSSTPKIVVVLAHTGANELSEDVRRPLSDYFAQVNDVSELITLQVLSQKLLYDQIVNRAEGKPIVLEVMLRDWGRATTPFSAVYGRVSTNEVVDWVTANSRDRLLAQNIRKIIADSAINENIASTLKASPERFWYFNNGITILCDTLEQKPLGAGTNDGVFVARNVSIVNGAQTAGAIALVGKIDSNRPQAYVQVRIISLKDCPPEFAKEITRATNTQNRVEAKDFASLDPVQERLRRDLLIVGRQYLIKAGEKITDMGTQCTAEEAAVALCCAIDVAHSTVAKNTIGRVWDDAPEATDKHTGVYRRVFPENLDPTFLWNCVLALREIDASLSRCKFTGREKAIATHANRFVAMYVLGKIPRDRLHSTNFKASDFVGDDLIREVVQQVDAAVAINFPQSYPAAIFKNLSKCQTIESSMSQPTPVDG